ncbi:MAG: FeoA domain-containing protein [Legionellales bacterium]|jgi:Fe2+ transport system protein FeoA|nr:FeoA domain-containing protein [Legionellales bacterium]NDH67379.1 ferrous iron transport protein A [Gammaproteobacteria bacterium]
MRDLDDWRPGASFCLLDYGAIDQAFRGRLLAMGMTLGVVVRVIRIAPFGNPIQIDLRGAMLALRREDLQALHWKKL